MFKASDRRRFLGGAGFPGLLGSCAFFLFFQPVVVMAQDRPSNLKTPQKDVVFTLAEELRFKDRVVSGQIKKSEIEALLDQPVRNGNSDLEEGYGVELTNEKRERKKVLSCREWKAATTGGWYSATTYDMAMEGFLIRTCELLFELEEATPARQSFIRNVDLTKLDLLPVNVLTAFAKEGQQKLEQRAGRGETLRRLLKPTEIKERSKLHLVVEYDGFSQLFREAARADFNRDGIEDVLVFTAGRAIGGTLGYSNYLTLTRLSAAGPLTVIRADLTK